MNLGQNIKKLRMERNMTQEDLAEILNTTVKSVSRWENQNTYPDITLLPILARIFETTVDELLDVDKVKMDEYILTLKEKAEKYASNNELYKELELWRQEYQKFPNNEEICMNYARVMNIVNCLENNVRYNDELVKILERVLDKTRNQNNKNKAIQILAELYMMLGNNTKADFYAKQLTDSYFFTYDVMKTRYLTGNKLLEAVQLNTFEFVSEIQRETEFIIYNQAFPLTYRKAYLEKIIKLHEVLYDENDYGYDVAVHIFDQIALARMIIQTTNNKEEIYQCFEKIKDGVNYIINFKPHNIISPLLSTIKCNHIGSYSQVLLDMKNSILKQLNLPEFDSFKEDPLYILLIKQVNLLKK